MASQWSVLAGGLGRLLELGDTASAEEAQAAIETEIDREQAVFHEVCADPAPPPKLNRRRPPEAGALRAGPG